MRFLRGTLVSTHTHTDIRCLDVYQPAIVHRSELASSSWKHEHRVYVCEKAGILVADLTTLLLFAQDYPPQSTVALLQQVKAVAEAVYDDLLMEQANMVQTNSRGVQTQQFPLTQQENNMADQQRYGYYYRTEEMNREMAELEQENAEEQQRPLEAAKEGYGYGGYACRRYGYGK